jgi:hypothetical protein
MAGMPIRIGIGVALLALCLVRADQAMAQGDSQRALARDLAHLMLDDTLRRELNDQVTAGLTRAVGSTLQTRLDRRLQDSEWRLVSEIVRRFVDDTLAPSRTEELAADVYAQRFDEAELRELLAFQRSPVGRKAARLAPLIAIETAQAINDEIRNSPSVPRLVEELQGAFPVLRSPDRESP